MSDELREIIAKLLRRLSIGSDAQNWDLICQHNKDRWLLESDLFKERLFAQGLAIVPREFAKPSQNPQYAAAYKERHGIPVDTYRFDGQLYRWLRAGHEAMVKAAEPKDSER